MAVLITCIVVLPVLALVFYVVHRSKPLWAAIPASGSGHAHCGDEGQPVSLVAELRMPQWCPQAGENRGWSPAFTSRMLTRRAWRSR